MNKRNLQAGFSLFETMIVLMIVSIGIYASMKLLAGGQERMAVTNSNLIARQILDTLTSRIYSVPGTFPTILGPGSKPLVYVACYDHRGNPVPNKQKFQGFVTQRMSAAFPQKMAKPDNNSFKEAAKIANNCPNAKYEFHIEPVRSDPLNRVLHVNVGVFIFKMPNPDISKIVVSEMIFTTLATEASL